MRTLLHAALTTLLFASYANAQDATLAQLKSLNACELERLFEQAPAGDIPVGYSRGHVLVMLDAKHPRLQAHMQNSVWRGKHFDCDGDFVNQWLGFRAVRGHAEQGISSHDGKPCISIAYPPGAAVFGNTRDEMRQVGPGLFLCRLYELCPCPRFRGYFAIEVSCKCR